MWLLRFAVAVALFVSSASVGEARLTRSWSYDQLWNAADIVVIAVATATRDRKETMPFPGVRRVDAKGKNEPVVGQRMETTFRVVVTLKGKAVDAKGRAVAKFPLHYYSVTGAMLDGPTLVSFDLRAKKQYLMFLKAGEDGQYVAVSGQTDPWFSIEELRERARR